MPPPRRRTPPRAPPGAPPESPWEPCHANFRPNGAQEALSLSPEIERRRVWHLDEIHKGHVGVLKQEEPPKKSGFPMIRDSPTNQKGALNERHAPLCPCCWGHRFTESCIPTLHLGLSKEPRAR